MKNDVCDPTIDAIKAAIAYLTDGSLYPDHRMTEEETLKFLKLAVSDATGHWVVSVRDSHGEWNSLDGEYDTPTPDAGGTEEQVIAEEMAATAMEDVGNDGTLRAEWVEK